MDEEEFLKLWYTPTSTDSCPFIADEESFLSDSYVFKSFRSEFEVDKCFTPKGLKAYRDSEKNSDGYQSSNKCSQYSDCIPGYSSLSFLPKKSILTKSEMNELFDIIVAQSNFNPLSPIQHEKLNFYREKISSEQREYLSIAKSQWVRETYMRHKEILPSVESFINTLWQEQLERVRTYPKFYSQSSLISLAPVVTDPVDMSFVSHLRTIGKPPTLHAPNLRFYIINLNKEIEKVVRGYSVSKKNSLTDLNTKMGYHPEVSKDKIAEEEAVANNAHVVMSAGALLTLMDNHPPHFLNTWDLPITVKQHLNGPNLKQKVIYIDKPFTLKTMNQYERKNKYCKLASDFCLRYKSGVSRLKKSDSEEATGWDVEYQEVIPMVSGEERDSEGSDDNQMLIVDWNSNDKEGGNTSTGTTPTAGGCPNVGSWTPSVQTPPPPPQKHNAPEKGKFLQCITYNLWKIHKSSQSYLSKNVSKDLSVIIRCKQGHQGEGGLKKVAVKCEYQPEFGGEAVSLSEVTRHWASVVIRPNTNLLRVRVNPIDGEVIMFQELSGSHLLAEAQRLYQKNLTKCLASLQSILEKLTELPPGSYHLGHRPSDSAFAPLYKATNGQYELSLYSCYQSNCTEVAPERASWTPIDVNVITPTFSYFHRVPAMFAPSKAYNNSNKSLLKKNLPRGKEGKGNRRKVVQAKSLTPIKNEIKKKTFGVKKTTKMKPAKRKRKPRKKKCAQQIKPN